MNITQLKAASALGCRIQIWHLRPGATSSANGQWDDADPTVAPTFECPEHLYRVHPDDLHLLPESPEDRFEQFVQAEIARAPNALRELGDHLCAVLDEDEFPRANSLLLQLAAEYRPTPAVSNDVLYADADALIAHLDELIDDNGQGGDKWDPAQAAIAGIRAWQRGPSLAGADEAMPDAHGEEIDLFHELVKPDGWRQSGFEIAPAPAVVDEAPAGSVGGDVKPSLTDCSRALDAAVGVLCELTGERMGLITDDVRFDHLHDAANRIFAIGARLNKSSAAFAQPQGREAVDLEQFREAVEFWRDAEFQEPLELGRFGDEDDLAEIKEGLAKADRLLAIIDSQSDEGYK